MVIHCCFEVCSHTLNFYSDWLVTHNWLVWIKSKCSWFSTIVTWMLWVRTCCLTMYCLVASCRCFSAGAVPHHCHEASDNIAWGRAFQFWDGLQRYIKYLALIAIVKNSAKAMKNWFYQLGSKTRKWLTIFFVQNKRI